VDAHADLIDLFNRYFEVVYADTPEKKRECYRLRYEVYCKEAVIPGFDASDYPNGEERDEYDERSLHCLLVHKATSVNAGTVRIILPDPNSPDERFPVEKVAGDFFTGDMRVQANVSRARIGEISRLILAPQFRARRGDGQKPTGLSEVSDPVLQASGRRQSTAGRPAEERRDSAPRRAFPHAVLGLFVAIARMSVENNLYYLYGGMEPVCARFLKSFGIDFTPISPMIDYFGPCRTYLGYIPDVMDNIYRTNRQIWNLVTDNGFFSLNQNQSNNSKFS
jgi:N-acyl-L-homoserine lactone synthetase